MTYETDRGGQSELKRRTDQGGMDGGGRFGRFRTGLNPPSPSGECGFKSRPGHSEQVFYRS